MSDQHYLKPKQIRRIVEQVAAERRRSNLGYTQAEQDAVSTDPEAYERGTAFNPIFIYPPENPESVELPKVPDFKPETDATAFFADVATAIDELNAASEKFGQEYLQSNVRLIEARAEVDYLRNALAKAEQQLAEIEAEGDSTDRFKTAIEKAQTVLRGLAHRAVAIVKNQLQPERVFLWVSAIMLRQSCRDLRR
jgi:hypothetical protein